MFWNVLKHLHFYALIIGVKLDIPIYVYGPETHMTSIVAAALGVRPLPDAPSAPQTTGHFLLQPGRNVACFFEFKP